MTYALTYDVPIGPETYARIREGLGPERPDGLIAHLAWRTDTGLRYVDAWQSKDQYEAFVENRLHPVVHPILQETLGFVPPEPTHTVLDLIDAGPAGILTDAGPNEELRTWPRPGRFTAPG